MDGLAGWAQFGGGLRFFVLLIEFEANPSKPWMQGFLVSGLYDDGFVGSGGDGCTAVFKFTFAKR